MGVSHHTIIQVELNTKSINKAIKQVDAYRDKIVSGVGELMTLLLKEGETFAINNVGHYDTGSTAASISGYRDGNKGFILAGGAAVWIEFGTGVQFNGAKGSYPHPKAQELGMSAIGTYGKGNGSKKSWVYMGEDGDWHCTRGIPASLFMYRTARKLRADLPGLARGCLLKND